MSCWPNIGSSELLTPGLIVYATALYKIQHKNGNQNCNILFQIAYLDKLSILLTNFLVESHQPSHQFQITNFSVSSDQNVLYYSVGISVMNC